MKPFLICGMLALLSVAARANDSSFEGVGGSLGPTRGENKAIQMKREVVVLTASESDFSTRAEFVFQNHSRLAQTVTMGFPEANWGENSRAGASRSGFKTFATWVDGRRVAARREVLKGSAVGGFSTYWLKTVSFAPRQTRRVRVDITSPLGSSNGWGFTRSLAYAFTGANWRGDVEQSTLEVRITQPGLWRGVLMGRDKTLPMSVKTSKRGATFSRVWKHWPAEEFVTFGLERALPGWKVDTATEGGAETLATVRAAQMARVGATSTDAQGAGGFPTHAFTRGGVVYLSVAHLSDCLDSWGDELSPKVRVRTSFDARTGFDLRAGATSLHLRAGERSALINGQKVALGAPILLATENRGRSLFVPMAPVVKHLGLRADFQGQRLFRLERANWRG